MIIVVTSTVLQAIEKYKRMKIQHTMECFNLSYRSSGRSPCCSAPSSRARERTRRPSITAGDWWSNIAKIFKVVYFSGWRFKKQDENIYAMVKSFYSGVLSPSQKSILYRKTVLLEFCTLYRVKTPWPLKKLLNRGYKKPFFDTR